MTRKEQLYYLLFNYHENQYDTRSFCDQFVCIYSDDVDDAACNKYEKEFMEKFCRLAERYSPYIEDHALSSYFLDERSFRNSFEILFDEYIKQ